MDDIAVQFQASPDQNQESAVLTGILSPANGDIGLLIVVGGPQYRVGSHRQFVKLCRAAASAGIPAFRFDVTGMGDSTGSSRAFFNLTDDIQAAIEQFFCLQPQLKSVVLWGLCDGASAILIALPKLLEPQVSAIVLANPWVRQPQTHAQAMVKRYYLKRLTNKDFWHKFLSGKLNLFKSIAEFFETVRKQSKPSIIKPSNSVTDYNFVNKMRQGWQEFHGKVCILTSGADMVAHEFLTLCHNDSDWHKLLSSAQYHHLSESNHTFSTEFFRQQVEQLTIEFIRQQNFEKASQ